MKKNLPNFSQETLENLAIAAMNLKTDKELLTSIPLASIFSKELLKQYPEYIGGMCGTKLRIRGE